MLMINSTDKRFIWSGFWIRQTSVLQRYECQAEDYFISKPLLASLLWSKILRHLSAPWRKHTEHVRRHAFRMLILYCFILSECVVGKWCHFQALAGKVINTPVHHSHSCSSRLTLCHALRLVLPHLSPSLLVQVITLAGGYVLRQCQGKVPTMLISMQGEVEEEVLEEEEEVENSTRLWV